MVVDVGVKDKTQTPTTNELEVHHGTLSHTQRDRARQHSTNDCKLGRATAGHRLAFYKRKRILQIKRLDPNR
jgi:hypothetical protein